MSFMKTDVGEKIRYYRKKLDLSQEELALKAGIHPAYLGKLERNEKNPTVETMDKIVSSIGISYGEFFSDVMDNSDKSERKFYIDMVVSSLSLLSDEKLKSMAEAIVRILDVAKCGG